MNTSFASSNNGTQLLLFVASFALALALANCVRFLSEVRLLPEVSGGHRGKMRSVAREEGSFGSLEPALRYLGALVDHLLILAKRRGGKLQMWEARLTRRLKEQLIRAGQPLGLDHRELLAIALLCGLVGAFLGLGLGQGEGSFVWVAPGFLIGVMCPTIRLQSVSQTRFLAMSRQLPGVIDLMAMAMNAGSDFPGAMRRVVEGRKGVVAEEMGQVLLALDLGITRTSALIALRERVPVSDVNDLVRVVLLADKKGSPLTEALSQQAKTSRMRRSVRAEEAAARAAVWMLVPLMLLMVCILILVLGPMMCTGVGL